MPTRSGLFFCLCLTLMVCSCASSNGPTTSDGNAAVDRLFYDTYTVSGTPSGLYSMELGSSPTLISARLSLLAPPRGSKVLAIRDDIDSEVVVMTDPWGTHATDLFASHEPLPEVAFSPNGELVAYATDIARIRIRTLATDSETILPAGPFGWGSSYWRQTPLFSPDSKQLAIATTIGSIFHLAIAHADGSGIHMLDDTALFVDAQALYYDPHTYDWTPDGSTVYYQAATSSPSVNSIKAYDFATATSTLVLSDTGIGPWTLDISPSGRYFLYQKYKISQNGSNSRLIGVLMLYDITTRTSKEIMIPYQLYSATVSQCEWSADSKKVFVRTSESDASGSELRTQYLLLDIVSGTTTPLTGFSGASLGHLWWGRALVR